jgi:hypothetical protein
MRIVPSSVLIGGESSRCQCKIFIFKSGFELYVSSPLMKKKIVAFDSGTEG